MCITSTLRLVGVAVLAALLVSSKASAYTVIIDPGHGGKDPGAMRPGAVEKTLALDTSLRLAQQLRSRGIQTVFTRSSDRALSLSARRNLSRRYPDSVFVSVHYNAATNNTANGIETFYYDARSRTLATAVQRSLLGETRGLNRGVKHRGLSVLKGNTARGSILVEGGFISNPQERRRCLDPNYREGVARAIADGVTQAFGSGGGGAWVSRSASRPRVQQVAYVPISRPRPVYYEPPVYAAPQPVRWQQPRRHERVYCSSAHSRRPQSYQERRPRRLGKRR